MGNKLQSMALPECNLLTTEMFFSEAPVGSNISWQKNRENSKISDRKNSCQEQN